MSSKRRIRRRQCGRKRRYPDQASAQRGARFGFGLLPYKCPWCCFFHNGHPSQEIRRRLPMSYDLPPRFVAGN